MSTIGMLLSKDAVARRWSGGTSRRKRPQHTMAAKEPVTPAAKVANWRNFRGTLGGMAAGAGLAGVEHAAGALPEGVGPTGLATHYGLNTLYGGMLGNPAWRNRAFFQKTFNAGAGPAMRQFRPTMTGAAVPLMLGAVPRLAALTDTSDKFVRGLNKTMTDDPGAVAKLINNPAGAALEGAGAWLKGNLPAIGAMGAAEVGGALGGYGLGSTIGNLLAPDDESLSYEDRRNRERMRSGMSMLGVPLGGVAGMYLANRYGLPEAANKFFNSTPSA